MSFAFVRNPKQNTTQMSLITQNEPTQQIHQLIDTGLCAKPFSSSTGSKILSGTDASMEINYKLFKTMLSIIEMYVRDAFDEMVTHQFVWQNACHHSSNDDFVATSDWTANIVDTSSMCFNVFEEHSFFLYWDFVE